MPTLPEIELLKQIYRNCLLPVLQPPIEEALEVGDMFEAVIPSYDQAIYNNPEFIEIEPEPEIIFPTSSALSNCYDTLSELVKDLGIDFLRSIGFNPEEYVGRELEQKLQQSPDLRFVPFTNHDTFIQSYELYRKDMVLRNIRDGGEPYLGPDHKIDTWKSRFLYAIHNRPVWLSSVEYLVGRIKPTHPLLAEVVSVSGPWDAGLWGSVMGEFINSREEDRGIYLNSHEFKTMSFRFQNKTLLDFSKYEWYKIGNGLYLNEDTNPCVYRKIDLANGEFLRLDAWYHGLKGIVENVAEWRHLIEQIDYDRFGKGSLTNTQKRQIQEWFKISNADFPEPCNPKPSDAVFSDANVSRYLSALLFLEAARKEVSDWYGLNAWEELKRQYRVWRY